MIKSMPLFNLTSLTTCCIFSSLLIMGLISSYRERRKFMISLLSLELAMLGLFGGLIFTLPHMSIPLSTSIFLLVLSASEASLGLSLLITITRTKGSDLITLTSLMKC